MRMTRFGTPRGRVCKTCFVHICGYGVSGIQKVTQLGPSVDHSEASVMLILARLPRKDSEHPVKMHISEHAMRDLVVPPSAVRRRLLGGG